MKNTLMILVTLLALASCAKEEFAANKGTQSGSSSALSSASLKACAQNTLVSPKVDILMLWDNSSSFNVVNSQTRASMGNLITSVSERFDYHILSVPLISQNSNTLYEAQLVAKNTTGLNSTAQAIMKSKESAAASLSFSPNGSAAEPGVDRVIQVLNANRSNGIFRQDAYTMIVVISNEDDDSCESESGYGACSTTDWKQRIQPKINQLLCLRGNANVSGCSYSSMNSTMLRFINISPLTSCSTGNYRVNARYKYVAESLYSAPFTNGQANAADQFDRSTPDSYDLCSTSFSNIFDGVSSSIQQTLIKHKYDYWPVAGSNDDVDPDTIRIVRTDGKILTNRTGEANPTDGYQYIGVTTKNTRYAPSAGEPFTGHMVQLFGSEGNDKLVYPDCLTVTYSGNKSTYGYVYMQYGQPNVSTIQVYKRVNGGSWTSIPQSTTNGWDYMGLQYTAGLNQNYKILNLPAGTNSGYIIRLNGSYIFQNSTSTTIEIRVDYNSVN